MKLYRVNPISLQRAWRKRVQCLCSWVLWWPGSSLRRRTREMPDLGTVPALLFGLLPSNLCSRRPCAAGLWPDAGRFLLRTPAQSRLRECLCRGDGSRRETQAFSRVWEGFSVLIPVQVPLKFQWVFVRSRGSSQTPAAQRCWQEGWRRWAQHRAPAQQPPREKR